MRDERPRRCQHCGQEILSDLLRGWVSVHHYARLGYNLFETAVMWTRCHGSGQRFTTRHEPNPPLDDPDVVRAWLSR